MIKVTQELQVCDVNRNETERVLITYYYVTMRSELKGEKKFFLICYKRINMVWGFFLDFSMSHCQAVQVSGTCLPQKNLIKSLIHTFMMMRSSDTSIIIQSIDTFFI